MYNEIALNFDNDHATQLCARCLKCFEQKRHGPQWLQKYADHMKQERTGNTDIIDIITNLFTQENNYINNHTFIQIIKFVDKCKKDDDRMKILQQQQQTMQRKHNNNDNNNNNALSQTLTYDDIDDIDDDIENIDSIKCKLIFNIDNLLPMYTIHDKRTITAGLLFNENKEKYVILAHSIIIII